MISITRKDDSFNQELKPNEKSQQQQKVHRFALFKTSAGIINKPKKHVEETSKLSTFAASEIYSVAAGPSNLKSKSKQTKAFQNKQKDKTKQTLRFAEEPVVIANSTEPLTEEEHTAYFLTKEDEARIEKERLLVLAKYNRHKRNPARTKFDDDVDGPLRGMEELFDVQTISTKKSRKQNHMANVLTEQKRLKQQSTSSSSSAAPEKTAELLAAAARKVSKKAMADAAASGKADAAAVPHDRPKTFSLW